MFQPIRFEPEIEDLVRFVEETEPDRIVEGTVAKLRGGVSTKAMLTASALAVIRSTDVSVGHHGGPTHPVCGIHPVYHLAGRLPGEWSYLPVVQNIHLSNKHIHSQEMGPYILPELAGVEAKDVLGLRAKGTVRASEGTLEETRDNFLSMMQMKYPAAAEGHLVYLLGKMPGNEVLDLILTKAIPKNPNDDHYFLYPMYSTRAVDCLGWEWAPVLFRPVVRWQARNPFMGNSSVFEEIEGLLDKYELLEKTIPLHTAQSETDSIGELGERIGACDDFSAIPEILAAALAHGLSLEGAGEALSIGAATIFLRTDYGNPMDAHLHTGANVRRYLITREGVSLRNKLLALLTWNTGPEITLSLDKLEWSPRFDEETVARLPDRDQEALLDAIEESINNQPKVEDLGVAKLPQMRTAPELRESMALAQQYAERQYDPMALFLRLGMITCRDNFTEMHALKHHQAVVEEFHSTREPFRWVHLVSAVKHTTIAHAKWQDVYTEARELLKV